MQGFQREGTGRNQTPFPPVLFQQIRTPDVLVKSRINSDICQGKFYPLNGLSVISASYVVGITQYPVAVVIATPCTVLTETRIPTVPDAAAVKAKSVPTSVLNDATMAATVG